MYYIDVKQERPDSKNTLILLVGSFLLIVILYYGSRYLTSLFAYADILPFIAAVAFIWYFYRRYALAYRIVFSEGHVYVQRLSSGHGKPIWDAAAKDFCYFGSADDAPPVEKTTRFVLAKSDLPVRMAITGEAGAVMFHVDDKLISLIEAAKNAPDSPPAPDEEGSEKTDE